jgi:hypothetical protein
MLPIIVYDVDQSEYCNQSGDAANDGIHVFHDIICLVFNSVEEGNVKIKDQK